MFTRILMGDSFRSRGTLFVNDFMMAVICVKSQHIRNFVQYCLTLYHEIIGTASINYSVLFKKIGVLRKTIRNFETKFSILDNTIQLISGS